MKRTRLEKMCYEIWTLLTTEEREKYYYDCGTIEFVAQVSKMLYLDIEEVDEDELNRILDLLDTAE